MSVSLTPATVAHVYTVDGPSTVWATLADPDNEEAVAGTLQELHGIAERDGIAYTHVTVSRKGRALAVYPALV